MRPLTRRDFILGAGAAAAAGLAGRVLAAAGPTPTSGPRRAPITAARPAHGTLVLVTLSGGNDGLNTVIPVADPAYHAARPTLAYRPDEALALSDGMALHPKLEGLKSLWDAGRLAIVR